MKKVFSAYKCLGILRYTHCLRQIRYSILLGGVSGFRDTSINHYSPNYHSSSNLSNMILVKGYLLKRLPLPRYEKEQEEEMCLFSSFCEKKTALNL